VHESGHRVYRVTGLHNAFFVSKTWQQAVGAGASRNVGIKELQTESVPSQKKK